MFYSSENYCATVLLNNYTHYVDAQLNQTMSTIDSEITLNKRYQNDGINMELIEGHF